MRAPGQLMQMAILDHAHALLCRGAAPLQYLLDCIQLHRRSMFWPRVHMRMAMHQQQAGVEACWAGASVQHTSPVHACQAQASCSRPGASWRSCWQRSIMRYLAATSTAYSYTSKWLLVLHHQAASCASMQLMPMG